MAECLLQLKVELKGCLVELSVPLELQLVEVDEIEACLLLLQRQRQVGVALQTKELLLAVGLC